MHAFLHGSGALSKRDSAKTEAFRDLHGYPSSSACVEPNPQEELDRDHPTTRSRHCPHALFWMCCPTTSVHSLTHLFFGLFYISQLLTSLAISGRHSRSTGVPRLSIKVVKCHTQLWNPSLAILMHYTLLWSVLLVPDVEWQSFKLAKHKKLLISTFRADTYDTLTEVSEYLFQKFLYSLIPQTSLPEIKIVIIIESYLCFLEHSQ